MFLHTLNNEFLTAKIVYLIRMMLLLPLTQKKKSQLTSSKITRVVQIIWIRKIQIK